MDSLTGFELLTVIRTVLGVEISAMELIQGVSVVRLSRSLNNKLGFGETTPSEDATPITLDEVEAILESMMPANAAGSRS